MVYAVLVASAFMIEVALNVPLGSLPLALSADRIPVGAIALIVGAGSIAEPWDRTIWLFASG